jgi:hypothetical protein
MAEKPWKKYGPNMGQPEKSKREGRLAADREYMVRSARILEGAGADKAINLLAVTPKTGYNGLIMAKFRKSIKIAPGVKLNLSKSGVSGTFGGPGASVNIGKNGAYLNTGIPGTGIYDRKKLGGGPDSAGAAEYNETGAAGNGQAGEGAKIGPLATLGGLLVLGGLVFLIGYFAAGSFWLKKLIAAAVFILGIFLCIKGGGKNKPAPEAADETGAVIQPPEAGGAE